MVYWAYHVAWKGGMTLKHKFDALIAGAGYAGTVCARALAEKGKKVLVVERRPHVAGNAYDRLDEAGISGINIDGAKGKISEVMAAIVSAFDRQLDALYQGEVMDINAEIKVLQSLLTGDGLADDQMGGH